MKNQQLNTAILNQFNAVLEDNKTNTNEIKRMTEYGVIVMPKAVYAFSHIKSYVYNKKVCNESLNKTFHRSWKTIFESMDDYLIQEQYKHYASTYGTGFSGMMYLPCEVKEVPNSSLPLFVIDGLPKNVIVDKCVEMLKSGMALKSETIDDLLFILRSLGYSFKDVDWVKNKEAMVKISDMTGKVPSDQDNFVRYLVYKATGETLVIKNDEAIEKLKYGNDVSKILLSYDATKLSEVFNRYKPLLLALKNKSIKTKKYINKVSKLSKKNHVPMPVNPLNHATNVEINSDNEHWLKNATPFALFRALNACHMFIQGKSNHVYKIRNGKTWVSTQYPNENKNHAAIKNYDIILNEIKERFGDSFKGKKVFVPSDVSYSLPTSEKMFVGNIPYGTKIKGKNLCVGIYWENNWGANDLDLSAVSLNGKVGWNSSFSNNSLAFSGDMTDATNGAVEYLHAKDASIEDSLLQVNCYSGDYNNHSYNIIVGHGNDNVGRGYMMEPSNLIINEKFNSLSGNSLTGIMSTEDGNVVFSVYPLFGTSARVSSVDENSKTALNALIEENNYMLRLEELLTELGVEFTDDEDEADVNLSIDEIDRSTFMKLFS